jgi:Xaa-Pro aminopeptidase
MANRIARLRAVITRERLDGLLVSNLANVRYLCGYTGSNGAILITRKQAWFYTDFRYQEQVKTEVRGCRRRVIARDIYSAFPVADARGVRRLGVESGHLTVGRFALLRKQLRKTKLVPSPDLTLELRRTKEPAEAECIARAQRVTDRVFREVLPLIKPGVRERDIAIEIDFRFRRYAEGNSFDSIVASGPNAAKPHADPSARRLRAGDCLTLDIGCRVGGYSSDMTRTVFIGRVPAKLRRVYEIVLEAQRRALALVGPGATASAVDAAARDHITAEGFGPQFGHSLGHGVGLDVHERPVLAARSKDILAPGDVVTVEPGIYLPGIGGVRIEDMVLVTRNGYRNFTRSPKRLIEL